MLFRMLGLMFVLILWVSCKPDLPAEVAAAYDTLPGDIDFNRHIKPILSDRCFSCHGPDKGKLKAGLRLDNAKAAYDELPESPGKKAIVPGNLRKSELFKRIISTDPDYLMPEPTSHLTLSAYEKALLIKWIEKGAQYKPHWAFIKPVKAGIPQVRKKTWVNNPIDHFILNRLETVKLEPSPEADKEILLRRLSLDLTGLPPTLEEINSFLNDNTVNAYEKQVDRLLKSPHYGEKMAADWLDVARFADSHGYTVDRLRDMSPWRDWVIKAFNENLPYNDFITWQLAGDLLKNPTKDQLIATAFNRNHQHNMEGGIVEEEFRVEYVSDRLNTTSEAFMGLTIGCAKCHDHKFDPVSQKNYYEMFSFFNNVKEAGQISWDNAMPVPSMLLPGKEIEKILLLIKEKEKEKEQQLAEQKGQHLPEFNRWLHQAPNKKYGNEKFPAGLVAYFPLSHSSLGNVIDGKNGIMLREGNKPDKVVFTKTEKGTSVLFDGDIWLSLGDVGKYKRSDPFSVGVWVNIPKNLKKGVIFHRGLMQVTYNYRGFHLMVDGNRLQLEMAHTDPYNAIIEYTKTDVPRDQWVQLTVTYDGSSTARGFKVFLNGEEMQTHVDQDNLYKDITFANKKMQPGIQFGAWERGSGLVGGKANDITVFDRDLTHLEVIQLCNPALFKKIIQKDPLQLTVDERKQIEAYYLSNFNAARKKIVSEIKYLRQKYNDSVENVQEVMVMQEMPKRRRTYVLDRGEYNLYKEEVFPDVPKTILSMPKNLPLNRLGLAKWLTLPDHPLTARVTVNRYWQMYFGRGLVKTAGDFGNQGDMPSHPELLDWLAISFIESGWNVKALQKLIVMSATYRQRSNLSPQLMAADPENILLARGPSNRLTAEMLRDNALFASGLMHLEIGGPSVKPYQPADLWKINGDVYAQDTGYKLYRRGIYTIWKRSVPNPTQSTFDVGIRTNCIVGRQNTNTPLQALIMLNDPTFVEAAKVIGEQITSAPDNTTAVVEAFRKLTGRRPGKKELSLLLKLQAKEYQAFRSDKKRSKGWIDAGSYKINKTLDINRLAANAVLASTIINTDAAITKR